MSSGVTPPFFPVITLAAFWTLSCVLGFILCLAGSGFAAGFEAAAGLGLFIIQSNESTPP
jgi:hypothetical protein